MSKDSLDSQNSLDFFELSKSPIIEEEEIFPRRLPTPRYTKSQLQQLEINHDSTCKDIIPPNLSASSNKYPLAILDINLHGAIQVNVIDKAPFNVTFQELPIHKYLSHTDFCYRSNTLSGCYNYVSNFYEPERLEEWYKQYVKKYNMLLTIKKHNFDTIFPTINYDQTNTKLKKHYKDLISIRRKLVDLKKSNLSKVDNPEEEREYIKETRDKARVSTHMYKQLKEYISSQSYIHPTHILNKSYSATSSVKKHYDINNPESSLILSYVYEAQETDETEENSVEIIHFDLLQLEYNPDLYKYRNNCIYSLKDLLEFIFPRQSDLIMDYNNPDNSFYNETTSKIKPFIEYVDKLTNVQANPHYHKDTPENIAEKEKYYSFNTENLLSFLNILNLKKLYVYDNSCSGYEGTEDLFMIQHIDETVHELPKNIARGTRKRKTKKNKRRRGITSSKKKRHHRKRIQPLV